MSFRQFGGMNYAARHNIVGSNYNTSNNLLVTQNVGQPNSFINFESDISGNVNVYGDIDISGNINVASDIDCSGNVNIAGDIDCSGNVNIAGDIDISGNITSDIECSGNVNIAGDIECSGNVNIVGDIDCSSNISAQYMFLSSYPPNVNQSENSVVPKGYVDSIASGIKPLSASITVSFSPITLSGTGQTVSGVTLSSYEGSYILVNGQGYDSVTQINNPDVTNGVYIISSEAWLRSEYLEPGGTYTQAQGTLTTILQGDYQNHRYICVSNPSTVGEDPLLWSEFEIPYSIGQGLETVFINNETILQVDSSLNFLTLVDASSSNPTLDIGTENALTITMGKLNGSTNTNINGNTIIGGTLGVTGASSLTTLNTSGLTTLNSVNVSTTLGVTGNTNIGGTLGVTGDTTLSSTLAVSGSATIHGTLGVTGATSLTTLATSGNTTINGTLNLSPSGIMYSNGSAQTIAYTGAGIFAGTYTNSNMTIDANGKITSISNGTVPSLPFVPRATNYSNTFSGITAGTIVNFTGSWDDRDYIILRVTVQVNWEDTGTGWNQYATSSGQLIVRPFYFPSGNWANDTTTKALYTTNSGNSNIGSIKKSLFYTGAINNGTQSLFYINGNKTSIQFKCDNNSAVGGAEYTHLIEYISASTTAGTVTFVNGAGTNNSLP